MSLSCSQCGKIIKTGPFANYDDLPSTSYPGVCRGCIPKMPEQDTEGTDAHNESMRTESAAQSASLIGAVKPSFEGDVPTISIVLYILCGFAVIGGFAVYNDSENPFWLALMIVEVTFTLAFASIINYLYSAKNSLRAIERKLFADSDK